MNANEVEKLEKVTGVYSTVTSEDNSTLVFELDGEFVVEVAIPDGDAKLELKLVDIVNKWHAGEYAEKDGDRDLDLDETGDCLIEALKDADLEIEL